MRKLIPSALLLLFALACGGLGDVPPTEGTAPAAPDAPAAPAAPPVPLVTTDIPNLGLKVDIPEGSTTGPVAAREGMLITGDSIGLMNIYIAVDPFPKTLEEAKAKARKLGGKDLKAETLAADGWLVTYSSSIEELGQFYTLEARHEIGGTSYVCTTALPEESKRDVAAAVCRTLRP